MIILDEIGKQHLLAKHSRNEPIAISRAEDFLAERGQPALASQGARVAAVRELFTNARKAHGVE